MRLTFARNRNGPLVVLAQEDRRQLKDTGKIQTLVEIALGGGAVSKKGHGHIILCSILDAPCQPHCMKHLGTNGHGYGQIVGLRYSLRPFGKSPK